MRKVTITGRILQRPVTVMMFSLMVIGFGLFALNNLKVTLLPEFNIPVLAVSVNYSNVSPEDMSRLVVEPIEGAIMGVDGIDQLESNVRRGGAFLILRLRPGTNVQKTELKLREAMDRIRPQLPSEANQPVIFQFDPDRSPIMRISVESSVLGLDALRQLSVDFIEPRFERIPGVASAETRGGLQRNFFVSLDPDAMARHRVVPSQVVDAINQNNVNLPIGTLVADRVSYTIRAESLYRSVEEIGQTVVRRTESGIPVRVSDVARVERSYADINSIEEVNGRNSVTVDIMKQSDANTLEVTRSVISEMVEFGPNLPSSVSMQVLSNEGDFIDRSISNLSQSALVALVVVILILLLFMGGWRIALVVAMSIPVSLTATFAAMYFMGITLNIISITGLALAIGLLVDNSIVVTESIANKLEEGQTRMQAALDGPNEVGGALLGSTLTTLAVFVPVLGVTGITGTMTRDLVLTISIAITSSFLASIILIPVLASLLIKREDFLKKNIALRWLTRLEKNYGRLLFFLLERKVIVALFVVAVLAGSWHLFRTIPAEFFPETDTGELSVRVEYPAGTQLARTAEGLRDYTEQVMQLPEVRTVITSIGRQRWTTQTNLGEMRIHLVDQRYRDKSSLELSDELHDLLAGEEAELEISVEGGGTPGMFFRRWGGPRGVQISLAGSDMETLREFGHRIENRLLMEEGVMSVSTPRTRPVPEWVYDLDRERLSRLGVTGGEVAGSFGTQARGSRAGFFREEGREIPIQVRNMRDRFQTREDLFALQLVQHEEARVPITALGQFRLEEGMQNISRRDREVMLDINVMVRGDVEEFRPLITRILSDEIILPDGYRYDFSGFFRQQEESGRMLGLAMLFALLLTYMVMASLFENFRDPFIIMFSVPLAFFGSLLFLFITDTALSVPAYIGIVILIGIVVNNGIVLVDYIHQYTGRKPAEGRTYLMLFLQACRRRMRPILLTAMTTIFSMVPLALELGAGAETWSPLARSVIGGLAFATLLTLFVIPAVVVGISGKRRGWIREGLKEWRPGRIGEKPSQ